MKLDFDVFDYGPRTRFSWWMYHIPFFNDLRLSIIFLHLFRVFPKFGHFKSLDKIAIHILVVIPAIALLMYTGLILTSRAFIGNRFEILAISVTFSVGIVYYLFVCSRIILQLSVSITATTSLIRRKMPMELLRPIFVTPVSSRTIFNSLALPAFVLILEVIEETLILLFATLIPVTLLFVPYCIVMGLPGSLVNFGTTILYTVCYLLPLALIVFLAVNVAALVAISVTPFFVNLVTAIILLLVGFLYFLYVDFVTTLEYPTLVSPFDPLAPLFWTSCLMLAITGIGFNILGTLRIERLRHLG